MPQVVFLLVPYIHLLDLAGPAQVFSTAADKGLDYRLSYVAEQEDVTTAQGISLNTTIEWPDLKTEDLLVVPGWRWHHDAPGHTAGHPKISAATARRIAEHHAGGGTVASVCAGAFALGQVGLLDGRRCTTHHALQNELAQRHPRASVARDVLYVEDGRIITSAGIASGIDLALHLVATRHGPGAAARVARTMVVYTRRNGDEPQASAMLRHRAHMNDAVHRAQDLIDARYTHSLPLAELAAAAGVGERTLTRHFTTATGHTPLRYQQELRLERAEHLISQGATVESAAQTVGFQDARMLRRLRARH
ncbi:GlxA family transcriptional regulator [Actinomadura hibisca]|uniref:GlxA family transcriptional regulator n=1 Tax=Actinomadura hibisca TaxID=68565 RepID=UPI00082B2A34|nr:AraC family transcriptional regulator [Actinomadura hibisca]